MLALAAALLLAAGASASRRAPAGARATTGVARGPAVALAATFRPKRLGAPTTISFAVSIDPSAETTPIPLSEINVSYPANLGLATSGLGLEACDPTALEREGPSACPANSKMGQGSALIEVPFGSQIVRERTVLGIYAAPSSDGYLHLAIIAVGAEPVIAQIVLSGILLPGDLKINVPPVASLPGAPYASLVKMQARLGGALTYYEHVHGHTVAYHPPGIGLPDSCPHGGWRVAASFAFIDGRSSNAGTVIPCPHKRRATRH